MIDLQFYATPAALAARLVAMASQDVCSYTRILDACAGDGALGDAITAADPYGNSSLVIDCVELDATKHPVLRDKARKVVGLDFLAFEGGACYDLIVLNPPFNNGVKHVLKAWDSLWKGEILAIINAETLRNPFSEERKYLVELLRQHGRFEFVQDAFKGEGVQREADVEVALVQLAKPAECTHDWVGPVIESIAKDNGPPADYALPSELALPEDFVTCQVRSFRQAVKAMRESVRMAAVARHYAVRLGGTMDTLVNRRQEEVPLADQVRAELAKGYDELKDRAWASVLRSTEALNRLSSRVQKQAESQFAAIRALQFDEVAVYGFLCGLVESQPEMMAEMACDVFDQVMRYWSDNACFYKGWKSNDRHRTLGMRMKTTRFVLPNNRTWGHALDWGALRRLADFDRVFAMLDGRQAPEVSLVSLFEDRASFSRLKHGERLSGSYLEIRWYPKAGTIHFFPRSKALVDRLNRVVGRRRGWLPPAEDKVPDAFWIQFDRAEKFDKEFREEVAKSRRHHFDNPLLRFMSAEEGESKAATPAVVAAMDAVLERNGLLEALEHSGQQTALLLPA